MREAGVRSSSRAALAPWSGAESCQGMARRGPATSRKARVPRGSRDLWLGATSFLSSTFRGEGQGGARSRACVAWGVLPATILKGLILAQNERWRRGLGMQVERAWQQVSGARVSKATVTNPMVGYSRGKLRVIPSDVRGRHRPCTKALAPWDGPLWY